MLKFKLKCLLNDENNFWKIIIILSQNKSKNFEFFFEKPLNFYNCIPDDEEDDIELVDGDRSCFPRIILGAFGFTERFKFGAKISGVFNFGAEISGEFIFTVIFDVGGDLAGASNLAGILIFGGRIDIFELFGFSLSLDDEELRLTVSPV